VHAGKSRDATAAPHRAVDQVRHRMGVWDTPHVRPHDMLEEA
jgi:hypothetical protein